MTMASVGALLGLGKVMLQMTPAESCHISQSNQAMYRQWADPALCACMLGIQCPLLSTT